MIAAAALVVAAAFPPPLLPAQEAFARADYARAETLALEAAQPPQQGAALYLAGLARFRSGRPAEALQALEAATRAADAPAAGLWHYNRASCLYELGRFSEAEADYLAAADDPAVAAVSLANAGFAALEAGSSERAREHLARARRGDAGGAASLLAELEAQLAGPAREQATLAYRAGLAAYDAGRFDEARARFTEAARLDPADGRSRLMSGAADLGLGLRSEARAELVQALALHLDEADARTARDYLDAASGGLAAQRRGLQGTLRLGGGYDSDPLQTGYFDPRDPSGASSSASALASGGLSLGYRARAGARLVAEALYDLDQLAYLAPAASDRSLQQHELALGLEYELRPGLRASALLTGELALTGLSGFRGLQAAGGAGLGGALDEGDHATTRLDLRWSHKQGLASEFTYLTGERADATLTQELRFGDSLVGAGYRFRAELIGAISQPAPPGRVVCLACPITSVVPYDYLGNAVWLSGRTAPFPRLLLAASAGVERRSHLSDEKLLAALPQGGATELFSQRRQETRWFGSASATLLLPRGFSLSLAYDLLSSRSDTGDGRRPPEQTRQAFDKHVLTLGTAFSF